MRRFAASLLLLLSLLFAGSCSTTASAGETGPITVGLFADLSSTGAADGNDALKGAQLLIKELNAAGGINGRQI